MPNLALTLTQCVTQGCLIHSLGLRFLICKLGGYHLTLNSKLMSVGIDISWEFIISYTYLQTHG